MKTATKSGPRIVVIGGGTGSFTLLSALKNQDAQITAIVNMVDSGGSTGVLRDEHGVLPPGDVRQCLVALAEAPEYLRDLFNYRFQEGGLDGHSFGNLFLTALEKLNDNYAETIEQASKILKVKGTVLPVTVDDANLAMELNGKTMVGEGSIDVADFDGAERPRLYLDPAAEILPGASEAIWSADLVVIAPGSPHTSIVPVLLTDGMSEALASTQGKVVMVANLVNKATQTNGYKLSDYLDLYEGVIGKGVIDAIIYNDNHIPKGLLEKYAEAGEKPVEVDLKELEKRDIELIAAQLISKAPLEDDTVDSTHGFIRHDERKTAKVSMRQIS